MMFQPLLPFPEALSMAHPLTDSIKFEIVDALKKHYAINYKKDEIVDLEVIRRIAKGIYSHRELSRPTLQRFAQFAKIPVAKQSAHSPMAVLFRRVEELEVRIKQLESDRTFKTNT